MSSPSGERVLVATRDLFFRAKLEALVRAAGATPVRDPPAALAVVELAGPDALERVRAFVASGVAVIGFGSHVAPDTLRAAREAGAAAVPNSRVERAVRDWLEGG